MADPGVPLDWTRWLGKHFLQRPARMIAIFGMYRVPGSSGRQLFRLVSENLGRGCTFVQYFAIRIDQRDRIGTVLDKRPKSLNDAAMPTSPLL